MISRGCFSPDFLPRKEPLGVGVCETLRCPLPFNPFAKWTLALPFGWSSPLTLLPLFALGSSR